MIQTLVPPPVRAAATGRRLGYALTSRALLLLLAGSLLAIPGFFHSRHFVWTWAMAAWDAVVILLAIFDASLLPAPANVVVERRFDNSPVLGEPSQITLEMTQTSNSILDLRVTDALHPALDPMTLIQTFYGAAEHIARLRGRNPDTPRLLKKVTRTL